MSAIPWRRSAACAALLFATAWTSPASAAGDVAPGNPQSGTITQRQWIVPHRYVATQDGFVRVRLFTSPSYRPYMWIYGETRNRETWSTNGTWVEGSRARQEAAYVLRIKKGDVFRVEVTLAANLNGFVAGSDYQLTVEEIGR
jgi:hypothetical protein